MPYIQSPTGIYHEHREGGRRTRCGMIIGEGWVPQDAVPGSSLAHECDRCKEASARVEGLRVKRFDSPSERQAQKIRQMQRDAKETPKIG